MGIRPSNTTELVLQDVVIPESYRVGREGEGFRIAMNTLDSARPFVGAVSVGIAQAALDCAVKYAKERRQFGQPIASFQMVQGMLADMAMKVEPLASWFKRLAGCVIRAWNSPKRLLWLNAMLPIPLCR